MDIISKTNTRKDKSAPDSGSKEQFIGQIPGFSLYPIDPRLGYEQVGKPIPPTSADKNHVNESFLSVTKGQQS
jgi:hypothetical protein